MLAKTITYEDFNDEQITETFYFNLSRSELQMLEISMANEGGLLGYVQALSDKKDVNGTLELFKKCIELSYGEKSPDGKRLVKSQEAFDNFRFSNAYDELVVELLGLNDGGSGEAFTNFLMGIIPKAAREEIIKQGGPAAAAAKLANK